MGVHVSVTATANTMTSGARSLPQTSPTSRRSFSRRHRAGRPRDDAARPEDVNQDQFAELLPLGRRGACPDGPRAAPACGLPGGQRIPALSAAVASVGGGRSPLSRAPPPEARGEGAGNPRGIGRIRCEAATARGGVHRRGPRRGQVAGETAGSEQPDQADAQRRGNVGGDAVELAPQRTETSRARPTGAPGRVSAGRPPWSGPPTPSSAPRGSGERAVEHGQDPPAIEDRREGGERLTVVWSGSGPRAGVADYRTACGMTVPEGMLSARTRVSRPARGRSRARRDAL